MTQKIDASDLDVVIIGAGPAGCQAARELSGKGRRVVVIEHSGEIGQPNYSSAMSGTEIVGEFGLPGSVISATWKKIAIVSPNEKASWEYPATRGYVFDFASLKKFLFRDAVSHGCEFMVGTTVTDFITDGEKIFGVRYHGVTGDGQILAKVIVDATGHAQFANNKLKLNPVRPENLATGIEYQMTGKTVGMEETLTFFVGSGFASHGYGWIFPMNGGSDRKVGICTYGNGDDTKSLEKKVEYFTEHIAEIRHTEPMEIHAGSAYVDGGVSQHVRSNLLLIGDSAHQINPLTGEGIRHAMIAARLAAGAIHGALTPDGLDERKLKQSYEAAWKKKFGINWKICQMLCNLLYRKYNDVNLDWFVKSMKSVTPEDLYGICYNYDFSRCLKYPFFLKMVPEIGSGIWQGITG